MLEVLDLLLKGGLIGSVIYGICHIATVIGKCFVATKVSDNKELSDNQTKFLTKMMSKDININIPTSHSEL